MKNGCDVVEWHSSRAYSLLLWTGVTIVYVYSIVSYAKIRI